MKARMFVLVSAIALAMPMGARAEVHPGVVIEVSDVSVMGYRTPFLGVGGELIVNGRPGGKYIEVKANALYSETSKVVHDNLQQVYGEVRLVSGIGRLRFGGGVTASHLRFSYLGLNRYAIRPFAAIGVLATRDVVIYAQYVRPGKDDSWEVRRAELLTEGSITKHIRLDLTTGYVWADPVEPFDPICDGEAKHGVMAVGRLILHF